MNQRLRFAKSSFLPCYFFGTWAVRQLGLQIARRLGICPIIVLYYHRVADQGINPWTISNRGFRRQIDWLSRRFEFISLREAQLRLASKSNQEPAVSITFDDGYADNCDQALPLLIERQIPFTYFVATKFVLENRPFPHDVTRGEPHPPNTVAELRSLADAGIDIGAHTRTHLDLGQPLNRDRLRDEILGSREDLEQMIGREVHYFAFPFGQYSNLSAPAAGLVRDAGFSGFCSAYGGYNFPGSNAFHLQRIHADPNWHRFRNWMTFDPRIALFVRRWNESQGFAPEEGTSNDRSQLTTRDDFCAESMLAGGTFQRATAVDGNDR